MVFIDWCSLFHATMFEMLWQLSLYIYIYIYLYTYIYIQIHCVCIFQYLLPRGTFFGYHRLYYMNWQHTTGWYCLRYMSHLGNTTKRHHHMLHRLWWRSMYDWYATMIANRIGESKNFYLETATERSRIRKDNEISQLLFYIYIFMHFNILKGVFTLMETTQWFKKRIFSRKFDV